MPITSVNNHFAIRTAAAVRMTPRKHGLGQNAAFDRVRALASRCTP
jgi:hypothetical protein